MPKFSRTSMGVCYHSTQRLRQRPSRGRAITLLLLRPQTARRGREGRRSSGLIAAFIGFDKTNSQESKTFLADRLPLPEAVVLYLP